MTFQSIANENGKQQHTTRYVRLGLSHWIYDLFSWFGAGLFFLMLFVPTSYQLLKLAITLLVLAAILVSALKRGRLSLHPLVLLWTLTMVSTGLVFILLGSINGGPDALRVGTVYVLWPLVFTAFVAGVAKQRIINLLFRVLVLASVVIPTYILTFILHVQGWLPGILYVELDLGQNIRFYSGFVEYGIYSLSSLIFLIPFVLSALYLWPKGFLVSRIWLWIALVLGLICALLSERRGLWFVLLIAPIITVVLSFFLRGHRKGMRFRTLKWIFGVTFLFAGLFFILHQIYEFDLKSVWNVFIAAFDPVLDNSAQIRSRQMLVLVEGWLNSPLWGSGHGTSAKGLIRSIRTPWAYELTYLALLFHTGIIGFVIYASGVLWIFWMGFRILRSRNRLRLYVFPVLVGTTCFLVANATNPYLAKYDYMWVIFLPIALINFWLLKRMPQKSFAIRE